LLALESKRVTHLVGHRKNDLNYYGVLDGHAGARASEFAKNDLPGRLARVHHLHALCYYALMTCTTEARAFSYMEQIVKKQSEFPEHTRQKRGWTERHNDSDRNYPSMRDRRGETDRETLPVRRT